MIWTNTTLVSVLLQVSIVFAVLMIVFVSLMMFLLVRTEFFGKAASKPSKQRGGAK